MRQTRLDRAGGRVGARIGRATGLALLASVTAMGLGGCIVGEIRDNLKTANAKLDTVDAGLRTTNAQLDQANTRLDGVGSGLGTTNQSLSTLQEQLRLLQSIDQSLDHLDEHLGSLRRTINKLDSAIPFLDIGGDAPIETAAAPASDIAPAPAPAGASETAPAAPVDGTQAGTAQAGAAPTAAVPAGASAAPAGRDPLLGPWLSVHPAQAWALILLPASTTGASGASSAAPAGTTSGRYIVDDERPGPAQEGRWERSAGVLRFTPDVPPPAEVGAGAPAGHAGAPPAVPAQGPWTATILFQTSRSLTLRVEGNAGGEVRVLSRP